jgi:DNA-binding LacI/PurR family transcriptional regulator
VNELLALGHTKIIFAAYHFFLSSEQERFDGYNAAMRQAGAAVSGGHLLKNQDIDYTALARRILDREITAVFCCNDRLAIKLIRNLLDAGVRVPEDVSVTGFDDWSDPNKTIPMGLTTVRQDFAGLGMLAANLLLLTIKGIIADSGIRALQSVEYIRRESTAKLNAR